MEAHAGKLYHLGIGKSVTRSNLSKANEQRNYRIFEEYATFMIAEARKRRINKIFELDGHIYAFDSTTLLQSDTHFFYIGCIIFSTKANSS